MNKGERRVLLAFFMPYSVHIEVKSYFRIVYRLYITRKNQWMKKLVLLGFLFVHMYSFLRAQSKPAYLLYDSTGQEVEYNKMIQNLATGDMVFFGEYHQNPISHWMQREVTASLYELRGENLILGAEMFECGNQLVIDEYLQGFYPERKMLPEITQLWNNYKNDYRPLLDFAKENALRFLATNIPRRYASMISNMGMDALKKLSPEALKLISPDFEKYFDPTAKAYAEMADIMDGMEPQELLYMQMAQASKDATMAYFSLKNFRDGNLLLHFCGSYHSNYNQGIIWWIHKVKSGLDIKSITTVSQTEWDELSTKDRGTIADYILVVADGMTN